jgi:hypothetical protein
MRSFTCKGGSTAAIWLMASDDALTILFSSGRVKSDFVV